MNKERVTDIKTKARGFFTNEFLDNVLGPEQPIIDTIVQTGAMAFLIGMVLSLEDRVVGYSIATLGATIMIGSLIKKDFENK
ncbi:MAG: hypothetical protein M1268_01305 [Patescibacteria group bacterium]|nr:hypothetical protein [Patescibacteria group bacterium]